MDAGTTAALASVVVATIATGGTVVTALIARKAEVSARTAEVNTRPMSNGFAADVLVRLGRIEAGKADNSRRLGRIEDLMLDHLNDHAEKDKAHRGCPTWLELTARDDGPAATA